LRGYECACVSVGELTDFCYVAVGVVLVGGAGH